MHGSKWLIIIIHIFYIIEGSLEVKLPTIWTDEKQRWEESRKRREEERRSKKRKFQKKEDPGARKGRKVAKHCVFPMICGSGGSKSRLAKAAGAEPAGQMREEKLHAVVARSTFRSQTCKKLRVRSTFGRSDVVFRGTQGIVHLVKSEQNVGVLWHFQKRWQVWSI